MTNTSSSELAGIIANAAPHKRRKFTYGISAGVVIILIAGFYFWTKKADAQENAPSFVTEPLSRGDIELVVTATGNLEPTNEVTVGSELSGTVLEVYVDSNDTVTKGQPLLKLDTTELEQQTQSSRANLLSSKASLAQAKATLKESEADFARLEKLREISGGKLPSQIDWDSAEATLDRAKASVLSAEASVAQSEAQLAVQERQLEKAVIKSPIDGVILTRDVEPGATVAASFTAPELFTIAESLEQMQLIVSVAEADIGRLQAGQTASFSVDAWPDRTYQAEVYKVSYGSTITDNVVTYDTELRVSNADLSLRPGMTVSADIRVAQSHNTFLVSAAALRFDPATAMPAQTAEQKKSFVQSLTPMPPRRADSRAGAGEEELKPTQGNSKIWILNNGQPEAMPVKVGISNGRFIEVSSEQLRENLPVITRAL